MSFDDSDRPDSGIPRADRDPRSTLERIWIAFVVGGRDVLRDPVLVGLLVFLPVYFVGVWGWIVPDEAIPLEVSTAAGTGRVVVSFPELMGGIVAPVTGALVAGIAALFLVQRSRAADSRLLVVGYHRLEVLAARFGVLSTVAAVVVVVSTLTLSIHLLPDHLGWYVLALVIAAGTYGAVGAAVGALLGRTAGVYLLLFAPMLDLIILQNPLADPPWWATWLPGHHSIELALSAAFASDVATVRVGWALGYLVIAATVAAIAYVFRW